MNSFELNKIMGAVLATCLLLLVTSMTAGAIFAPGKVAKPGYEIAVKEDASRGAGPAKAAAAVPIETLLANASVEKGQAASKKSAACHNFNFSAAMKAKTGKWTIDDLNKFIESPKGFIPGTAMGFAGISKDTERADLLAYLNSLSDSPAPLPGKK